MVSRWPNPSRCFASAGLEQCLEKHCLSIAQHRDCLVRNTEILVQLAFIFPYNEYVVSKAILNCQGKAIEQRIVFVPRLDSNRYAREVIFFPIAL